MYLSNLSNLSDSALIEMIAAYVRHHRLEQNKTQSQLAEAAGINRTTLVELEKGKRMNVITLIQLLRALDKLDILSAFEVQPQISPLKLAELQHSYRKRASNPRKSKNQPKSDW